MATTPINVKYEPVADVIEPDVQRDAVFSAHYTYRFMLSRIWDEDRGLLGWIGLNPSIAGKDNDDPTVRRMWGFTKRFGYGGFIVGNLNPYIATDPKEMDPFHTSFEENDEHLRRMAARCVRVVACWGASNVHPDRAVKVVEMFRKGGVPLYCLGTTKFGRPRHPLYLAAKTELVLFEGANP